MSFWINYVMHPYTMGSQCGCKFNSISSSKLSVSRKKIKNQQSIKKIIVTDSVFSMDGDCALLKDLIALSSQYNAYLFIDDAHGFGVYGKHGLGLMEEQNCLNFNKSRIIHLTTFGKAAVFQVLHLWPRAYY